MEGVGEYSRRKKKRPEFGDLEDLTDPGNSGPGQGRCFSGNPQVREGGLRDVPVTFRPGLEMGPKELPI